MPKRKITLTRRTKHPLHQLKWRYGIDGDVELLRSIQKDIIEGRGLRHVWSQNRKDGSVRECWLVNIEGREIPVIYAVASENFPSICTFPGEDFSDIAIGARYIKHEMSSV